jgi:hypothetical protein
MGEQIGQPSESADVPEDGLGVEDFLEGQDVPSFLGIIERVPGELDAVRITPWSLGIGCSCWQALEIPKSSISWVRPTEHVQQCCGGVHRVVEIHFSPGVGIPVDEVFNQLARTPADPLTMLTAASASGSWQARRRAEPPAAMEPSSVGSVGVLNQEPLLGIEGLINFGLIDVLIQFEKMCSDRYRKCWDSADLVANASIREELQCQCLNDYFRCMHRRKRKDCYATKAER